MLRDWNMDRVHEFVAKLLCGRQLKERANHHGSLHVPHAFLHGLLRSCSTRAAASVICCACCAVRCEGELSGRVCSAFTVSGLGLRFRVKFRV